MAYVAADEDGIETIHKDKPFRHKGCWQCGDEEVNMPKGSIEKLIGKTLTWEDEPVELKEE